MQMRRKGLMPLRHYEPAIPLRLYGVSFHFASIGATNENQFHSAAPFPLLVIFDSYNYDRDHRGHYAKKETQCK
jgi:hypothetical protein